jgi:hypothetical protein
LGDFGRNLNQLIAFRSEITKQNQIPITTAYLIDNQILETILLKKFSNLCLIVSDRFQNYQLLHFKIYFEFLIIWFVLLAANIRFKGI